MKTIDPEHYSDTFFETKQRYRTNTLKQRYRTKVLESNSDHQNKNLHMETAGCKRMTNQENQHSNNVKNPFEKYGNQTKYAISHSKNRRAQNLPDRKISDNTYIGCATSKGLRQRTRVKTFIV